MWALKEHKTQVTLLQSSQTDKINCSQLNGDKIRKDRERERERERGQLERSHKESAAPGEEDSQREQKGGCLRTA